MTVLGSELVLSGLILYSVKFRQLLCGKPVILIENGKLMQDNLRRTRVTLDELTGHLRKGRAGHHRRAVRHSGNRRESLRVSLPQGATCQRQGCGHSPQAPVPPRDHRGGRLPFRENLGRAGKDEAWLKQVLQEHRAEIADTLLLTLDAGNKVVWLGKEYSR